MADPHIAGVTYIMFVLKEKRKKGPSDEGEGKKGKSKKRVYLQSRTLDTLARPSFP